MVHNRPDEDSESAHDSTLISPRQSALPSTIGRFEIVRCFARGSYTKCYEATTPENCSQRLLLKLVDKANEPVVRWFEKCVTVTASLNHPHILPLLESGQIDDCPYIVMPLVDGGNLVQFVHSGTTPHPAEVVRIVRSVASALDYAHARDVVHGNVHPKHVLLSRSGHVSMIGFAEVNSESPDGMIFGNPQYVAPEQLAGFDAVPSTDVYGLAEIAFLLLSGTFPFKGTAGIIELMDRKRFGPVPSIRDRRPELSCRVDLTLQRAMALRPDERFPSAGQFVEELGVALKCC
jgi:serine/threonine protein kinase